MPVLARLVRARLESLIPAGFGRLARFAAIGHTPGRVEVGEPKRSLEFPFTLDLRKVS